MKIYIHALPYALTAALMAFASTHTVHMLQLEGYKNKNLFRWILSHAKKVYSLPALAALTGILLASLANLLLPGAARYVYYALAAAYAAVILVYTRITRIDNPKKPIVYTGRVKRLFVFIVLVELTAAAGLLLLDLTVFNNTVFAGAPLFALMPTVGLSAAAANTAAAPLESAVRRWYYNDAGKKLKRRDDLIRVGITGSFGKTSCKFILGAILSEKYNVLVPPSSYNTTMGVTRVIRERLLPSHEVLIAEMGARHIGDIKEICGLVKPRYGLLTSVGPQHLETFGSIENIAKTKYELIEGLGKDGCSFFPSDSEICRKLYEKTQSEKYLFGMEYEGAVYARAENIKTGSFGSRFDLVIDGESICCETKLLGKHNIANITGCAAVAKRLGLSADEIRLGIRKAAPVEHRLQLLPTKNGITVIDDAFNANPSGARAAMEVLSTFEGRKIVVTPGLVELGEREEEENRAFGKVMAGVADIVYLIGNKRARPIYNGLLEGGFEKSNIFVFSFLSEAADMLWKNARTGDVVIFENDLPDNYNE
ncbi:MAG: UDP-N-acetylmuramoyl-tripeptide--D-alanyl-D-alanine ligase [Christensenellales bacterium]